MRKDSLMYAILLTIGACILMVTIIIDHIANNNTYTEIETTTEIITEEIKCTVIFKNSYQDTKYYIGVYINTDIEVIEITEEYYNEIDIGDIILVDVSGDKLSIHRYG